MAITPSGLCGVMNGTTPVNLATDPGSGARHLVRDLRIHNRDTAAVTVTLQVVNTNGTFPMAEVTLQPGETLNDDDSVIVIDAGDVLQAVLSDAPETTNPTWFCHFATHV